MERKKRFFRKKRGIAGSAFSWLLVFAMVISNVSVSPGLFMTVQAAESEAETENTGEAHEIDGAGEDAQTPEGGDADEDINGTPVTTPPAEGSVIKVTAKATDKNYKGEVSATFRVIANDKNMSSLKVTVAEQQYTGKEVELGVEDFTFKQKVGGKWVDLPLTQNDFEIVSYSNNIKKGTAKVTIHGLSEYGGTKTVTFKIKARPMK